MEFLELSSEWTRKYCIFFFNVSKIKGKPGAYAGPMFALCL